MMDWTSVKESLPTIPKNKYGIGVLVTVLDEGYEAMHPGEGRSVHQVEFFDGTFMEINLFGGVVKMAKTDQNIIAWSYLPEPYGG